MSPPIPVMSCTLPDAAAYACDLAPPNVQVVQRELPAPDGSSKSAPSERGKEEKARRRTVTLANSGPKVLIFHYGKKCWPSCGIWPQVGEGPGTG